MIHKLLVLSYEAKILRYTYTHRVYNLINSTIKQQVINDPKPVIEPDNNFDNDSGEENPETKITESSKSTNKSITRSRPSMMK
jgi:hypothetical protein